MNTKICPTCKKELSVDNFSKRVRCGKEGLQPWCKACQKIYKDRHYKNNKQEYFAKNIRARAKFSEWWREYKKQFSCLKCGETHPGCLDFHHHAGDKEKSVSEYIARENKRGALKEIEKCICLCSNCHRKLHYEEKYGSLDL